MIARAITMIQGFPLMSSGIVSASKAARLRNRAVEARAEAGEDPCPGGDPDHPATRVRIFGGTA